MADLIAQIALRSSESWILHPDSRFFDRYVEEARTELDSLPLDVGRVALCDRHPVRFLARFSAIYASGRTVLFCNPDWAAQEWQQVKQVGCPDAGLGDVPSSLLFSRSPKSDADRPGDAQVPHICIPTGGSSGQIKFACHTWETLTVAALGLQHHMGGGPLNSFCLLPLFHVSGFMQFVRSLVTGGDLFLGQSHAFLASQYDSISSRHWCLSLVPTQLKRALDLPCLSTWLSGCRAIFLGGAPAWTSLLTSARHQNLPLAPTYGATETAAQVATLLPQDFRRGIQDCASVLPHVEVAILDAGGRSLPANSPGQIAIRAKSLAMGYLPETRTFARDLGGFRWWMPDDIGFLDADGRLHVLGRNSDKILTGGENVFPAEVEAAIRAAGLVDDVTVLGMPDREWGEVVTAVCVLKAESPADSCAKMLAERCFREIDAYLHSQLARYKHPKRWLAIAALPRNQRGKVDRQRLREVAINASELP